jgi:hypothetical protein
MAELRAEFGGACVDCGHTRGLEFSHVKPTGVTGGLGRGMPQRYHDIKKNPDCYRLRCKRCHRTYDANHWQRLQDEQTEAAP